MSDGTVLAIEELEDKLDVEILSDFLEENPKITKLILGSANTEIVGALAKYFGDTSSLSIVIEG